MSRDSLSPDTGAGTEDANTAVESASEERELAAARRLSSAPEDGVGHVGGPSPEITQPSLGPLGWLRWFWRQLTSMRVALLLLFLLSLAAIPGSMIPQETQSPARVAQFHTDHTKLAPIYDKLDMFHVFSSWWFAAIYILLFVSLAGCILPRSWQFAQALRARPPRAPRRLDRMPAHLSWTTSAEDAETALALGRKVLGARRFRLSAPGAEGAAADSVAAEKGYLREAGNLVFHIALFGLLFAVASGSLWGATGTKLMPVGSGFANTLTQYDDFNHGPLYTVDDLGDFSLTLNSFTAKFAQSGPERGTATEFKARVTYRENGTGKPHGAVIQVNDPLDINGEKVFLVSHGYSPRVTVRDAHGNVVYRGASAFLPYDNNLSSKGVFKIPDGYRNKAGKKEQIGLEGIFLPTFAGASMQTGMASAFPAMENPALLLTAYHGDLNMDGGIPQSVYQLDHTYLKQYQGANKQPLAQKLGIGDTMKLPNGEGSITLDGVDQWASFTISHNPGTGLALWSAVAAILGLMGSLFVQRRRVWVRARDNADGTVSVEVAGLGRSESARIGGEVADVAKQLQKALPPRA
ncbi:cytochrome C biogenesis protein [Mangrovactinospora gilvigrisea]|uniref:Cytochrome C biogenesis protein n=1 Tax=Mangrovactinospora gilvigrisea TaxID=1428644 RepID=A0A1J7BK49_9ACTN|nr:cytochrome c biogenesis protein ResB [Mangrovactinospora gilvigrisea]OIV39014.1 cytochrome C biogenesis protein [Mangrovactinospora gilvigrisea]